MTPFHAARLPRIARLLLSFAGPFCGFAATESPPRTAESIATTLCVACHGTGLMGGSGPSLLDARWNHGGEDKDIAVSIRDGWPASGMPPFAAVLRPEEIGGLVVYLRQQHDAFAAGRIQPPPPPPADPIESELHTFRLETIADGLDTPWGLAFLPDGRMLITERKGNLRIVEPGRPLSAPIADTPRVYYKQDGGLLDLILHPDYDKNGWIYLAYSEEGTATDFSMTVVVRGRIVAGRWTDQKEIFRADPKYYSKDSSHFGCRFLFDPKGNLFFTVGDRGLPEEAQDLTSPLGKIHRVKDDGSVPSDNPFVNRPGALGSIWSYGHRHPQGLQYHPVTGRMWETEHGPIGGDELNVIDPAHNYGWPLVSRGVDAVRHFEASKDGMDSPAIAWSPSIAPSGIEFYTGDRFPLWKNQLFVAGLIGQQLRRIEVAGDRVVSQEILFKGLDRVRTVVNGPDGLLYLTLNGIPGRIVRLVPSEDPASAAAAGARANIRRGVFGRAPDGTQIESFTLTNRHGALAKIATYGAMVTELRMPDRDGLSAGVVAEVVASEKGFVSGFARAAAVMGRVVNRIANARFTLDGREYLLTPNLKPNHIHGGDRGFDKAIWRAEVLESATSPAIKLTYLSPDGENGYPGNLDASVIYTLTEENALRIEYAATTDKPTPVNLTNHAYFNLGGGGDVLNHELEIAADRVTATDDRLIPTGEFLEVAGTALDFTRPAPVGARASKIGRSPNYDHNYVLNRAEGDNGLFRAARVYDPGTGRALEVWTTEPGVQLYTSKLSELPAIGRIGFFALETQHFPDSVNHSHFPSTILRPGNTYRSTTEFRFSAK